MSAAPTFGDPEAMRALAREIAARADVVSGLPGGFSAALDGATFEGPAAGRLREASLRSRRQLAATVAELRAIATALYADATAVERANAQAAAEAERAEQAAAAAAAQGAARS
jgi:hypothetical protein